MPVHSLILEFCSKFVHLTMVSHEMMAGYFILALLQDHGFLETHANQAGDSWLEVYYATAVTIGMFVAYVFWASVLVSPLLMVPIDLIFPKKLQLTQEYQHHLMFCAMLGPSDPIPECSWQTPFRRFMQYIHTLCPLLLVVDARVADHSPSNAALEFGAAIIWAICYLSWNLFCWWLLRVAPYPLQKRFYQRGLLQCLLAYVVLVVFASLLCAHARHIRSAESWLAVVPPTAIVLWMTVGLAPFKGTVARLQGLDPGLVFQGWASGSKSAFLTKEAEDAYMASRGDNSKQE